MIEDARVLATDLRLQFEVELPPKLPAEVDRALWHTALFNLINNAIKYNEPDGKVSIRLTTMGSKIVFDIGNTGAGIPTADESKVFERFYRVAMPRSQRVDGIGLGLSLAREILHAHGGELLLMENRPGWISFRVTLPVPPP
jgi:two-component system, OmpR family, heavy metal sensor histidine kinase CusS